MIASFLRAWLLLAWLTSLHALEWRETGFGRQATLQLPAIGRTGFSLLPASQTGVAFTNSLARARGITNQVYFNGSGVAAADVDADGWCDLFFAGLGGGSRLYRNLGQWKFEEVTAASGIQLEGVDATGAVLADMDGDGDFDLLVSTINRGTHLFINDGRGHFHDVMTHAGLSAKHGSMSMAVADIDHDGDLDLYVTNYRPVTLRDQPRTNFRVAMVDGRPVINSVNGVSVTAPELQGRFSLSDKAKILEHGELDILHLNNGDGTFLEIPVGGDRFRDEDGNPSQHLNDWGLSVLFHDLNGDGWPDLYVCNDFDSPDRIWINQGQGQFRALPRQALRSSSKFSMGADVADVNRDGFDDILVLDMLSRDHVTRLTRADRSSGSTSSAERYQAMRNSLQLNRGDGTYAEIAFQAGLEASDWSWTPIFLDVDFDGFEDVLVTTGHARDDMDHDNGSRIEKARKETRMTILEELQLREKSPSLARPKVAFRNRGDLTFEEISAAWHFNDTGISHGMCLADLDNDGDLDVVVNNLNQAAGVYRNETTAPRVAVRLKGAMNSSGIGARIKAIGGAVPFQSQEISSGGRYLSSDQPMRVFAAGSLTNRMRLEVTWPGGKESVVENAQPNRIYEISEKGAAMPPLMARLAVVPLFEDVSASIRHLAREEEFNDFERQPLLPRKLRRQGSSASWCDLNQDGWEDLILGAGRGGQIAVYTNDARGNFAPFPLPVFVPGLANGVTGVLPWWNTNGHLGLIAGLSHYEDGETTNATMRLFDLDRSAHVDLLPGGESSIGPIAMADLDGDGVLELFVGGHTKPGRYPEPASSRIYRQVHSRWLLDETNSASLRNVGIVNAAVWSDLNADGYPELVLACDWGPIKIFANEHGRLSDATLAYGLDAYRGWWNGLAVGDFDGDGRLDLVASNWGRNSKYQVHLDFKVVMFHGDLQERGEVDLIETYVDPASRKRVPFLPLDLLSTAAPFLRERFTSYRSFAQAGIEDMLGPKLGALKSVDVNWLDHTVFLNRGKFFDVRSLPSEAQQAPAFGVSSGDLDGDGKDDLFLAQNFFATYPETSRYDAGRGLVLAGDGDGKFRAMPGQESGIKMYGEQRASALCDFDHDGRMDIVVTQIADETKLYRNRRAQPCLRVRLRGPAGNPDGIGCVVWLESPVGNGPAHEVHSGTGVAASDASTLLIGGYQKASSIVVRWPGGKISKKPIPLGAMEMVVP